MKFIKENYIKIWKFLKEHLLNTIIVCTLIFIICAISGIMFGINYSEETKEILLSFIEANQDLLNAEGLTSAGGLIKNNTTACAMSILFGILPFIFLTLISLSLNGFMIGIVLGFSKATTGASMIKSFVLGILPHGIFELPALIISMSMGIYLCLTLTLKIFGRGKIKIIELFKGYLRIFISLIIPMLIFAGFIEAYVTPILLRL